MGSKRKVTFLGVIKSREALSDYYAASDLFIFPSMYDNAPLVVREAAAMGTPSILVEGSTASEVVRDGRNGFLTPDSPGAIASRIISLASRRDLVAAAPEGARATLVRSWKDVVDEVYERYQKIITDHKR